MKKTIYSVLINAVITPLAQWSERWSYEPKVLGSSPLRGMIFFWFSDAVVTAVTFTDVIG